MTRRLLTIFLALLLVTPTIAADADKTDAARSATLSWLSLTDSGQYAASWDTAAVLFKGAVTRDDWTKTIRSVRGPLGTLQSRVEAGAKYTTTLPGAPDGEYVVFQFRSSFANKASGIETVTAMRQDDGSWRVSGYFIK